jgi:hypothetical protein
LIFDAKTKRAAFRVNGMLWRIDPAKGTLNGEKPAVPERVTSRDIVAWQGQVFYGLGETLHALDLATGQCASVIKLPGKIDNIAVSPRGQVYVSCGADLYHVVE